MIADALAPQEGARLAVSDANLEDRLRSGLDVASLLFDLDPSLEVQGSRMAVSTVAAQAPMDEKAIGDFITSLRAQAFFRGTTRALASEIKGASTQKLITIRLSDKTLDLLGYELNGRTLTVTSKTTNRSITVDIDQISGPSDTRTGKISLADYKLLHDQAHQSLVDALGALLTDAATTKKVLVHESAQRLGGAGSPAFDIFVANALQYYVQTKDANTRFGVDGMDQGTLLLRLGQLEKTSRLPEGTLTRLFTTTGFEADQEVFITNPEDLSKMGRRNLVVQSDADADLTLAVVEGRLSEAQLTSDQFINAAKTRMDHTVGFDNAQFIGVLLGRINSTDIRRFYALLPVVAPVDWQTGARMAAFTIKMAGMAA